MILVDNCILSFGKQLNNGIHVPSFFGQENDNALSTLIPYMKSIVDCEDVTQELKNTLKITEMYKLYLSQKIIRK
jgi:TFIIF-interacting CTD phosphatase-like protein